VQFVGSDESQELRIKVTRFDNLVLTHFLEELFYDLSRRLLFCNELFCIAYERLALSVHLLYPHVGLLAIPQEDLSVHRHVVLGVLDMANLWLDYLEMRVQVKIVAQVSALELLILARLFLEGLTQDKAAAQL